ncbi:MAG: preprotein translocase subunit YajC [Phycisphaeraceae bacterium]|nr:preprotein translocase subunit YajC [Phycisphaeraceae bacterium]
MAFSPLQTPSLILAELSGPPTEGGATTTQPSRPDGGAADGNGGGGATQGTPGGGMGGLMTMLLVMVAVMLLISIFAGRKDKKRRQAVQAMLASLKKGQKVETIGGVLGTIQEVREDDVVLKVDEASNTRIRFARAAIKTILDDRDAARSAKAES